MLIEGTGTNSNTVLNAIGTSSNNNGGNGVGLTNRGGAKSIRSAVPTSTVAIRSRATWGSGVQLRGTGTTDIKSSAIVSAYSRLGLIKLANGEEGILIDTGAANNIIGGATSAHGNVISGNSKSGVTISGVGNTGNDVLSNLIGFEYPRLSAMAICKVVSRCEPGLLIRYRRQRCRQHYLG